MTIRGIMLPTGLNLNNWHQLAQQAGGGFSEDDLTKYGNDSIDFFANFLFTQMFRAAALENVRCLISHKDQSRLAVDNAYQIFLTEHHVEMDKRQPPFMLFLRNKTPSHRIQKLPRSGCNKATASQLATRLQQPGKLIQRPMFL
jgi:hypothetical protein